MNILKIEITDKDLGNIVVIGGILAIFAILFYLGYTSNPQQEPASFSDMGNETYFRIDCSNLDKQSIVFDKDLLLFPNARIECTKDNSTIILDLGG